MLLQRKIEQLNKEKKKFVGQLSEHSIVYASWAGSGCVAQLLYCRLNFEKFDGRSDLPLLCAEGEDIVVNSSPVLLVARASSAVEGGLEDATEDRCFVCVLLDDVASMCQVRNAVVCCVVLSSLVDALPERPA